MLHDGSGCQLARERQSFAAAVRQIFFQRARIDHADAAQADALLFGKIGMRFDVAQTQRMFAAADEIRREQVLHIGRGHRTVRDTALRGDDFDQRLQPEQAARTVAHDVDFQLVFGGRFGNGSRNFIRTERQRGGIAGNVEGDGHAFSPSSSISASNFFGVTCACSVVSSIWIVGADGTQAQAIDRLQRDIAMLQARCRMRRQRFAAVGLTGFGTAHVHDMLARRRLPEMVVIGDHAVHFGARQIEFLRDQRHRIVRHVTQRMLDVVQDGQQSTGLFPVFVEDGIQCGNHDCDSRLPVFRVAAFTGDVVVDQCRQQQNHNTKSGGKQNKTPAGLGQEHDHRIRTGRRMRGACRHHQGHGGCGGQSHRPPVWAEGGQKQHSDHRRQNVAEHHIPRLAERQVRVTEDQHAGRSERTEYQGELHVGRGQSHDPDPKQRTDPGLYDGGTVRARRKGCALPAKFCKKLHDLSVT